VAQGSAPGGAKGATDPADTTKTKRGGAHSGWNGGATNAGAAPQNSAPGANAAGGNAPSGGGNGAPGAGGGQWRGGGGTGGGGKWRGGGGMGNGTFRARTGVGGRYIVFIIRDGKPTPVNIKTGLTDLDYVEVTDGLKEGDKVIVLPSASLVNSQKEMRDRMQRMTGGGGIPGMQQQRPAGSATPPPTQK
jgi:hypothetical protein